MDEAECLDLSLRCRAYNGILGQVKGRAGFGLVACTRAGQGADEAHL